MDSQFDLLPNGLRAAGSVVVAQFTRHEVNPLESEADSHRSQSNNEESENAPFSELLKATIAKVCYALDRYGLPHATIQTILLSSAILAGRIYRGISHGIFRRVWKGRNENDNENDNDNCTSCAHRQGNAEMEDHSTPFRSPSSTLLLPHMSRLLDPLWQFLLTTYLAVCWTEDEPFSIRPLLDCLLGAASRVGFDIKRNAYNASTSGGVSTVALFNSDLILAMEHIRYKLRVDPDEIVSFLRNHLSAIKESTSLPQMPQLRLLLQRLEESVVSGFEFLVSEEPMHTRPIQSTVYPYKEDTPKMNWQNEMFHANDMVLTIKNPLMIENDSDHLWGDYWQYGQSQFFTVDDGEDCDPLIAI